MKYFKHMADMLEDPWVQDVFMAEHGIAGYGFICGIYEIYAKLCKDQPGSEIDIPLKSIARKLRVSSSKVKSWLIQCSTMGKLSVRFENISVEIVKLSIPKMVDLIDEWTAKLRRKSGETPPSYIEEEVKEKGEEKEKPPKPPKGESGAFKTFYEAYPRKEARPKAASVWRTKNLDSEFEAIAAGLERAKRSEQWVKDNGRFIPHPATWLNQERWKDETAIAVKTGLAALAKNEEFEDRITYGWG